MEILKKVGFKDKSGDVVWHYTKSALYVTATVAIVVLLIYVAGGIMKILTYTIKEYKEMQKAMNIPTGAVRIA